MTNGPISRHIVLLPNEIVLSQSYLLRHILYGKSAVWGNHHTRSKLSLRSHSTKVRGKGTCHCWIRTVLQEILYCRADHEDERHISSLREGYRIKRSTSTWTDLMPLVHSMSEARAQIWVISCIVMSKCRPQAAAPLPHTLDSFACFYYFLSGRGWRESRLNPGGIRMRQREYKHQPVSILKDIRFVLPSSIISASPAVHFPLSH